MKPALPDEMISSLVQGDTLPLPYTGLPELKAIRNEADMRKLLSALSPDAPLETINRQAEIHWRNLSELRTEDVMLLPLPGGKQVALAQVTLPRLGPELQARMLADAAIKASNSGRTNRT